MKTFFSTYWEPTERFGSPIPAAGAGAKSAPNPRSNRTISDAPSRRRRQGSPFFVAVEDQLILKA